LLDKQVDPKWIAGINRSYIFGPLLYVLAFIPVWVSVPLSLAVQFGLALFFALTEKGRPIFLKS